MAAALLYGERSVAGDLGYAPSCQSLPGFSMPPPPPPGMRHREDGRMASRPTPCCSVQPPPRAPITSSAPSAPGKTFCTA
ncbi:hypothetical protein GDO78_016656 [Eleutherodactylus coqui]|uniref:Uncharacterized protein n=1 Tax=Eleutherodactylus coqui TaxID=57060 RepID=A0A8J6E899_ELECQ|nr:hypothetical protein GDO78_016656 [Eleutherodactylus coqui]